MKIHNPRTIDIVERERERERESYTLVNKSAVVLGNQKLKNKIGKIKIEDRFKKCA